MVPAGCLGADVDRNIAWMILAGVVVLAMFGGAALWGRVRGPLVVVSGAVGLASTLLAWGLVDSLGRGRGIGVEWLLLPPVILVAAGGWLGVYKLLRAGPWTSRLSGTAVDDESLARHASTLRALFDSRRRGKEPPDRPPTVS